MSVSRSQLLGKKVYKPDASYVGEVADTGLILGSGSSTLIVRTPQGTAVELPWGAIAAAKDILILSKDFDLTQAKLVSSAPEAASAPQSDTVQERVGKLASQAGKVFGKIGGGGEKGQAPFCPTCGKKASWIKEYSRWYCYQDKTYL